jgi:hypothetical protein
MYSKVKLKNNGDKHFLFLIILNKEHSKQAFTYEDFTTDFD